MPILGKAAGALGSYEAARLNTVTAVAEGRAGGNYCSVTNPTLSTLIPGQRYSLGGRTVTPLRPVGPGQTGFAMYVGILGGIL
jgi:hypothetical protein